MLIVVVAVFFFFFSSISPLSQQEDLLIASSFHLACLRLRPEREDLVRYQQDNALLPYQTYSSSAMSIDLCFRLCRRWLIVINANHTSCTCLFTITHAYQFNRHLGQVLPKSRCSSTDLKIYSLTDDFDLFPSPTSTHDWSLDGCYYLHGIQTVRPNLEMGDLDYTQGMETCRKHCQVLRNTNDFSFFLSIRKSCYCLPVIVPLAVRKPLAHCSFLPSIQSSLKTQLNASDVHADTVVKIDVQRYCSSTFTFHRTLFHCFKHVTLDTYSKLSDDTRCSPVLIETEEQWTSLRSFVSGLRVKTFLWVDRNSTYLVANRSSWDDLCLVFNANLSESVDLLSCSSANSVLCAQKPLVDQGEFRTISSGPLIGSLENITCPPEYLLFNGLCYFVHSSFVTTLRSAEVFCSTQYINSTLVRFSSHEWSNINGTRFFGRTLYDALLEVFYYQLEQKLSTGTGAKHWLRLLLGDQFDPNECLLRYFTRASGAFTTLHRCFHGGHPVCQCQPISKTILSDEDLSTNDTYFDDQTFLNTTHLSPRSLQKYRSLLMIISGPLFALLLLLLAVAFLFRYVRRIHGSYTPGQAMLLPSRGSTTSELSNTPAVLYSRLPSTVADPDLVQLLPQIVIDKCPEEEEEPFYATVRDSYENK